VPVARAPRATVRKSEDGSAKNLVMRRWANAYWTTDEPVDALLNVKTGQPYAAEGGADVEGGAEVVGARAEVPAW
jgi:hypothetical protein